jgi:hypothetical protein
MRADIPNHETSLLFISTIPFPANNSDHALQKNYRTTLDYKTSGGLRDFWRVYQPVVLQQVSSGKTAPPMSGWLLTADSRRP